MHPAHRPMPRLRHLAIALAIHALSAGAAATSEPGPAQLADLPLDDLLNLQVTGASRTAQRRSEAAGSVTVITAAEIKALGYRKLADALRTVRGLNVVYDRTYSYLGVRGFFAPGDYNTRVLLLIDGNRVNENLYDMAFIGTEAPIDIDLVERIEFIPSGLAGARRQRVLRCRQRGDAADLRTALQRRAGRRTIRRPRRPRDAGAHHRRRCEVDGVGVAPHLFGRPVPAAELHSMLHHVGPLPTVPAPLDV
jgi:hypothetical protein